MFPEGWEVTQINSFGVVATGKTPSKERKEFYGDFMQFIKTPDMHGNMFILNTSDKLSQLGAESQSGKILPPDSICVSCIGTVGVISITTEPAQTNQQINSIILKDKVAREYLFYALQDIVPTMKLYAGTGATMDNLSKGKFESLNIVSPSNNIVEKYHSCVSPMFDEIKKLLEQNTNLRQTRDLLLPKLISGEVEV
jgi:type I restriction enzyme S subunit